MGTGLQVALAPELPLQTRRKEAWRGPTIWEGLLPQALWPAPSEPDHISLPTQALRSLKAKQRTEKRIEALHAKLDTVQGILDRIYASQTDQMVAVALCSSTRLVPLAHTSPLLHWGFAVWMRPGFFHNMVGIAFASPVGKFWPQWTWDE